MIKSLADLKPGEKGTILSIHAKNLVLKKLLDLGFTKGCNVTVIRLAPFGDPLEICIRGSCFFLRLEEAKTISVEVI